MNDTLHISKQGEKLIHDFEGCRKKAYYDAVGVLTIGWGHTNNVLPHFSPAAVWTQDHCDEVFRNDIVKYEDAVKRNVTTPLTQGQFDALSSLVYNIGEGNFRKSSLLRKINNNEYDAAAREFMKWNKAGGRVLPGLTRRRAAEALMFQSTSPSVEAKPKTEPMPQLIDAPTDEVPVTSSKINQLGAAGGVVGGGLTLDAAADAARNANSIKESTKAIGIWDLLFHTFSAHPFRLLGGLSVIGLCAMVIYYRIKDHS